MATKSGFTYLDIKSEASFVKIDAESAYQFIEGDISWQDVVAAQIALDPDSLNRYFRDDTISLSEVLSVGFEKTTLDAFSFSDSQILEIQKALADAVSFSDEIVVALLIRR